MGDELKDKLEDEKDELNIEDEKDEKGGGVGNDDEKDDKQEKTFTQTEINKIIAKEKRLGKTAVLKELGIDPANKDAVEAVKKFIEEQTRATQIPAEVLQEQAKAKALEQKLFEAETKLQIMRLNVSSKYVDEMIVLVNSKLRQNGIEEPEQSDIVDIINEYKVKLPSWFEGEEDKNNTNKGKGTGSAIGAGSAGSSDGVKDIGKRLAEKRKTSSKSSFFSK